MTTFSQIDSLENRVTTYQVINIGLIILMISSVIDVFSDFEFKKLLLCIFIHIPLGVGIFIFFAKKIKHNKENIINLKNEIDSDPFLSHQYNVDKDQHEFDTRVEYLRNRIEKKYSEIAFHNKMGQYDSAARCRGEIARMESELRRMGC